MPQNSTSSAALAGAKQGAAFGPWGAAIGAGVGVASDVIGKETGGSNTAGGPLDARSGFDGSGWTVSTGRSTATGARDARSNTDPQGTGLGPMQAGFSTPMIVLMLLVVAGYLLKKKG